MMRRIPLGALVPTVLAGGAQTYSEKVLALGPIAYWPLTETSGTTAVDLVAARNGTYTNVTLNATTGPDGNPAPQWVPASSSHCDINPSSTGLDGVFNGALGTLALWAKVRAAAVWADGQNRRTIRLSSGTGTNNIYMGKLSANNMFWSYTAGGTGESESPTHTPTTWVHMAMTWSAAADQVVYYYNGSQQGATDTSLGTWAGTLINSGSVIGADNNTGAFPWDGYLQHCVIFNKVLTPAQILELATV